MAYMTKYATKFAPIRKGAALSGSFVAVPIGTVLELVHKVPTEHGRALFKCEVNGQTLWGYQDIEFLQSVPRHYLLGWTVGSENTRTGMVLMHEKRGRPRRSMTGGPAAALNETVIFKTKEKAIAFAKAMACYPEWRAFVGAAKYETSTPAHAKGLPEWDSAVHCRVWIDEIEASAGVVR